MRYELYSYVQLLDFYCYRFETESDSLEDLFSFVLNITIPKLLSSNESNDQHWIYIDNEPHEFIVSNLGYTTVPTRRECIERICECKLQKHLASVDRTSVSLNDDATYRQQYERLLNTAVEEGMALGDKLFLLRRTPVSQLIASRDENQKRKDRFPLETVLSFWSGRRESNPHIQLGKLTFYH